MNVLPSGNRKKMEKQQYLSGGYASDSIIERMLRKIALTDVDMRPDEALDSLSSPREAPGGVASDGSQLQDTMNQSNSLPRDKNSFPVDENENYGMGQEKPADQGRFESKVNDIAQSVLKGLNLDPSQWTINTNVTSKGKGEVEAISITMKKIVTEPGPVVQKP